MIDVDAAAEDDILGAVDPDVVLDGGQAVGLQHELVEHAAQADAHDTGHPAEQSLQRLAQEVTRQAARLAPEVEPQRVKGRHRDRAGAPTAPPPRYRKTAAWGRWNTGSKSGEAAGS